MPKVNKMLRSAKKFGRCKIHGQSCGVCEEIRMNVYPRKTERKAFIRYDGWEDY